MAFDRRRRGIFVSSCHLIHTHHSSEPGINQPIYGSPTRRNEVQRALDGFPVSNLGCYDAVSDVLFKHHLLWLHMYVCITRHNRVSQRILRSVSTRWILVYVDKKSLHLSIGNTVRLGLGRSSKASIVDVMHSSDNFVGVVTKAFLIELKPSPWRLGGSSSHS